MSLQPTTVQEPKLTKPLTKQIHLTNNKIQTTHYFHVFPTKLCFIVCVKCVIFLPLSLKHAHTETYTCPETCCQHCHKTLSLKYFCIYSEGKNYLIPCWFCTFAHWQINYQSIILMVGLFEQWETEYQQKIQKNAFDKSYKSICILMNEISIWYPINQQDFWLPGVFYTGKELRLRALS